MLLLFQSKNGNKYPLSHTSDATSLLLSSQLLTQLHYNSMHGEEVQRRTPKAAILSNSQAGRRGWGGQRQRTVARRPIGRLCLWQTTRETKWLGSNTGMIAHKVTQKAEQETSDCHAWGFRREAGKTGERNAVDWSFVSCVCTLWRSQPAHQFIGCRRCAAAMWQPPGQSKRKRIRHKESRLKETSERRKRWWWRDAARKQRKKTAFPNRLIPFLPEQLKCGNYGQTTPSVEQRKRK